MVKGCEVDPALFFDDETDDITSNPGGGRTVNGAESGNTRHTDQQDGVNVIETEKEKRSLYRLISESDVEVCQIFFLRSLRSHLGMLNISGLLEG